MVQCAAALAGLLPTPILTNLAYFVSTFHSWKHASTAAAAPGFVSYLPQVGRRGGFRGLGASRRYCSSLLQNQLHFM